MWEPRCLTSLWVATTCYRDNFTSFYINIIILIILIPLINFNVLLEYGNTAVVYPCNISFAYVSSSMEMKPKHIDEDIYQICNGKDTDDNIRSLVLKNVNITALIDTGQLYRQIQTN
jgi:hypothetical protein